MQTGQAAQLVGLSHCTGSEVNTLTWHGEPDKLWIPVGSKKIASVHKESSESSTLMGGPNFLKMFGWLLIYSMYESFKELEK